MCVVFYFFNEVICDLWLYGFVIVKWFDDVDNVGVYFIVYFCDIFMEEVVDEGFDILFFEVKLVEVFIDDGCKILKKYVKGVWFNWYFVGMNFYCISWGVKRFIIEWMDSGWVKEKISGVMLIFLKIIWLIDDGYLNDIYYEYYNCVCVLC